MVLKKKKKEIQVDAFSLDCQQLEKLQGKLVFPKLNLYHFFFY